MSHKILAINPGSTSSKIAVYEDDTPVFVKSVTHAPEELGKFDNYLDQLGLRTEYTIKAVEENNIKLSDLSAVVGRGGLLPPLLGGGYMVNQDMIDEIRFGGVRPHASNLGALIAHSIAEPLCIPAYIYDAVSADEMDDIAKITGIPEITRQSLVHVLNCKATARKVAAMLGGTYETMNFIIAHIGGGISMAASKKGRIVDVVADDGGPFSPERAGAIPVGYIVDLCYSGKYTKQEFMNKLRKDSGLKGHLGTNDCQEIERRIEGCDSHAKLIYDAESYQIAKGISQLGSVLCGEIDAIILTGGMAHSEYITKDITRQVKFMGKVIVMPGEHEMEALSLGVLRILHGKEEHHLYSRNVAKVQTLSD